MDLHHNIQSKANASHQQNGNRMYAAAVERNLLPIIELVNRVAPKNGKALEIASGTGQHIVKLASTLPGLTWQPSDVDDACIKSIQSWRTHNQLINLLSPIKLDATDISWSTNYSNQNFILLVNLIHLVSENEAKNIINGISCALLPGGNSVIYGPFKRNGVLTSNGDIQFHKALQETDPDIGYKDDAWMLELFKRYSLDVVEIVDMPANNLSFIVKKTLTANII